MEDLKQEYIKLIRERSYLMETTYLHPSHYEEIEKLNKKIEELKKEVIK